MWPFRKKKKKEPYTFMAEIGNADARVSPWRLRSHTKPEAAVSEDGTLTIKAGENEFVARNGTWSWYYLGDLV